MVQGTGSIPFALLAGISHWGLQEYDSTEKEFPKIFEERKADAGIIRNSSTYGTGLLKQKNQGSNFQYDEIGQGFSQDVTMTPYASGFILTREMIDDNQYMQLVKERSEYLGESTRETQEIVMANVINRGYNSSYKGPDGIELFSTVHKKAKGGVQSNKLAVDVTLSEAALEQMVRDLDKITNDAGNRIHVKPKQVVVPTDLRFEIVRILGSTLQVDSANHNINALRQGVFSEGHMVYSRMTDQNSFFIQTNVKNGLKFHNRIPVEFMNDPDTEALTMKFKVYIRFGTSWFDPLAVYGSQGA